MDKGKEVLKRRIATARRHLNDKKIHCLILTKPANVTYLTGFSGEDSWAVITRRTLHLLTDSRYTEQAEGECRGCKIIQRDGPIAAATAKLTEKFKSVRTVHVEASASLSDFEALKKRVKVRLKPAAQVIEAVRLNKDSSEISAIRSAARIANRALGRVLRCIKPGITESELAGALDFEIHKLGARNSFETIVAFGPNASRPHHQPGRRKLKNNDSILIDFGARYNGYCSDLTRCFAVGRPSAYYKKVYEAVRQAQAAAIEMVSPGVDVLQVDQAARSVIRNAGLPVYGHGTGHGLGLEIHEGPVVSKEGKGKLKAGMVLTIEPGVYIPGRLGVRIEDDILVTENGFKILSRDSADEVKLAALSRTRRRN
ncbi:MAG TPA: aminopeptidase P family protein [Sedimentisphaerales bacterium]|nr:aminopeptidase P family protein [Sedimentisphaerales bacterium]